LPSGRRLRSKERKSGKADGEGLNGSAGSGQVFFITLNTIVFFNMRSGHPDLSQDIFEKLAGLDSKDRFDARGLLELLINRKDDKAFFQYKEQVYV
jgi:hypothetical protein